MRRNTQLLVALEQLIRAKGGRQELDYLHGFDALGRLRKAVVKMEEA
ncbi:MAG: hypothetical protein MI725_11405 [Pirellulales bacterium]|nr:hypothetical protein [Pirellulales bacterium]